MRKGIVVIAAIVGACIGVQQMMKKRKEKLIGYVPRLMTGVVGHFPKDVRIVWWKVGDVNRTIGIRMRFFDNAGKELISTTNNHGLMAAGVTFDGRQSVIGDMPLDAKLFLKANPHPEDPNAIEIWARR